MAEGPVADNIISMKGVPFRAPEERNEADDSVESREAMCEALAEIQADIRSGKSNGFVMISFFSSPESSGEEAYSIYAGPGVFENISRTIGVMERIKADFVLTAREA